MTPNRDNQTEFTLNENVRTIMATLRRVDLAWIANEIEEAVLEDWLSVQEPIELDPTFADWKESGATREPRGQGQETVALLVLRNYFLDLFDVWKEAEAQLREAIGDKRLHVELAPPGAGQPVVAFQPDYEKASSELRRILGQFLPEIGRDELL
jgi:hypothetical protein